MLLSHIIPLTINIILTAFELDYPCSLHGLCKPSHRSFNVDLASYVTLLIVLHKQIMDEAIACINTYMIVVHHIIYLIISPSRELKFFFLPHNN